MTETVYIKRKTTPCAAGCLVGIVGLIIVALFSSNDSSKPTNSTPLVTASIKPVGEVERQLIHNQVVKAAQEQDFDSLTRALKMAQDNGLTATVQQAKDAGYYDWIAKRNAEKAAETPGPNPYPMMVQNAVKSGLITELDRANSRVVVDSYQWDQMEESGKKITVSTVAMYWDKQAFNVYPSAGTNTNVPKVARFSEAFGVELFEE